ncbi:EAL domain-containing protein [Shewanella sp. GXUN23E]|uniref:EAL domain-containing protein n=1 Tax=Shewanella sp. GXUN23E TaxID=3422498 RepID=UPI003D7C5118
MSSIPLIFRYLLVALVPFILLQLSAPSLIDYKFDSLLQEKTEETVERMTKNALVLDNAIDSLMFNLSYTCDARDQMLLTHAFNESQLIRVIGLFTASGEHCSTLGDSFTPSLAHLTTLTSSTGEHFKVGKFKTDTLINFPTDKGNLFFLIGSKGSPFFANRPCDECFYMEMDINGYGNLSAVGKESIKQDLLAKQIRAKIDANGSHAHVWAGNKLHAYASDWAYSITLSSGIILSFLCFTGMLLWQHSHSSLEILLKQAISLNELRPDYQKIVDARDGSTVGYEALLRWYHKGKCISPAVFIDIAESSKLIMPITEQLIGRVLKDLEALPINQWVTINIVAAHLESNHLTRQLARLGWPKSNQLKFELTERQQIRNIPAAKQNIDLLMAKGYSIKIDDFGTGFGGMASLQQLNINAIKIDKMFVDTIGTDDVKAGILGSLIKFGHDYQLEMIAEGVETQTQAQHLLSQGVYLQQGYLYGQPGPLPANSGASQLIPSETEIPA